MTSAAYHAGRNTKAENAMRSLHEDGRTNDADGRSASDMAKLGQEPDKNDSLETIQEKLVRSTGSRNGRVSIRAINRIKRSSSENQRLLRRLNSDPGKSPSKRTEFGADEDAANRQKLSIPGSGLRKFFEAFHLLKKKYRW